jgi:hypothetical protein
VLVELVVAWLMIDYCWLAGLLLLDVHMSSNQITFSVFTHQEVLSFASRAFRTLVHQPTSQIVDFTREVCW